MEKIPIFRFLIPTMTGITLEDGRKEDSDKRSQSSICMGITRRMVRYLAKQGNY